MLASKYSIHDLSRCQGDANENLARFNMPLELGIALALRLVERDERAQHDWFLLVPRGHSYQKFVSDLAGFDPCQHDGTVETAVPAVMSWLATRPDSIVVPTPASVLACLPAFEITVELTQAQWHGQLPWVNLLGIAHRIAKRLQVG